ncbi:MAG: hypothetical protein R3F65_09815 [bacterium]
MVELPRSVRARLPDDLPAEGSAALDVARAAALDAAARAAALDAAARADGERSAAIERAAVRAAALADPAAALAAWGEVHRLDPEHPAALAALAAAHRAAGRWEPFLYGARRALARTGDLDRRRALLRAIAEVEGGPCERFEAAIEAWTELTLLAPTDPAALDGLERLYAATGRHAALDALLARRVQLADAALDPDAARALIRRRARLAEEALGDPAAALDRWRELAGRVSLPGSAAGPPTDAANRVDVSPTTRASHRPDPASAVERLPTAAEDRAQRAAHRSDPASAVERLLTAADDGAERAAHRSDPASEVERLLTAADDGAERAAHRSDPASEVERLLTATEDWPALAAHLDAEVERAEAGPLRAGLHRRRARLFAGPLADPARALAAWNAVLAELGAVPPADREALTALGALHRARGDRPATLAALQLLVAATPPAERVEALVALARHLDDTPGAAAEALATWEAARALRPDHPVAVEVLITRHADAGRADAAIALLRERLRRADDPLPDLRRLAALQREAGPRDASVETEREILAIAPADPEALANVAEWLAAGRRWPELITLHRAALAADPAADTRHRVAIAAVQLDHLAAPDEAFATLAAGPDAGWRDPGVLDLAHQAVAASADGLGLLTALAPAPGPAAEGFDPAPMLAGVDRARPALAASPASGLDPTRSAGPRLAAAVALADRLGLALPPAALLKLGAWHEAHGDAERANAAWRACLADRRGAHDPRAWLGIARHLAGREGLLTVHLHAMAGVSLPRPLRAEALRRLAALHRRRGAEAEAAAALARAAALTRRRWPRVLWALLLVAVLLLLAAIGYDLTRVHGIRLPWD